MFNQYDGFLNDEFFELLQEVHKVARNADIVRFLLGDGQ